MGLPSKINISSYLLLQNEIKEIKVNIKFQCQPLSYKPKRHLLDSWLDFPIEVQFLVLARRVLLAIGDKEWNPSSIYSWSIGHILEHEFFCLGHLGCAGSKGKKVDLSFSEQLLRVFFSTFCGQKKLLNCFGLKSLCSKTKQLRSVLVKLLVLNKCLNCLLRL